MNLTDCHLKLVDGNDLKQLGSAMARKKCLRENWF